MAVLSFLFPIAGWVYWGAKKDTNPQEAAKCARLAWIGFGVNLVLMLAAGA